VNEEEMDQSKNYQLVVKGEEDEDLLAKTF